MSFAASWLALREPHDHAARAAQLTDTLCSFLRRRNAARTLQVIDLACGSGSSFRYLEPRLGRAQHWMMVDHDEALLALLPASVEVLQFDLAKGLSGLALRGVDLVTASALLDLVTADWLDSLVAATVVEQPALLLALSYNGSMNWQPVLADDRWVTALFSRHQMTDKGFGPALGPVAASEAGLRLRVAGFDVFEAASPWRLRQGDQAMQRELAGGMVAALTAGFPDDAARLQCWLEERIGIIDAGGSTLEVGHTDVLALPAGSSTSRIACGGAAAAQIEIEQHVRPHLVLPAGRAQTVV